MGIVETILIIIASIFTLSWVYGIRHYMQMANRASQLNINATFLYILSILLVLILKLSPFHLLWMMPTSVLVGRFYQVLPFSLITKLSIPFEKLIYIGLDWNEINNLHDDIRETVKLVTMENKTQEEAIKIVKERKILRKSNKKQRR